MLSVLDLQDRSGAPQKAAPPSPEPMTESSEEIPATPEEFEFVLGRRQMASLAFVLLIVLVVCVSIAYLVGKSTSIKAAAAAGLAQTAAAPAPEPPPIILHSDPAPTLDQPDRPLFADPKIGAVYIQMGAVEKGVAAIFAEGLRRKGLPGFVAPGPSEKIFRVLIGPLPTPASYIEAKDAVDRLGLTTFARRFPD